jgi:hypothetical protein
MHHHGHEEEEGEEKGAFGLESAVRNMSVTDP